MRVLFTPAEERQIESWARMRGQGVAQAVYELVMEEIRAVQPRLNPNIAAAQALAIIKNYKSGKEFKTREIIEEIDKNHNFLYTVTPAGERKPTTDHTILGKKLASHSSMLRGGYKIERVEGEVNVYKKI